MDILKFELPYPPSVNHYYLRTSTGVIIGAKGKKYRRDVGFILHQHKKACGDKKIALTINLFPPDQRKRDLDNILKCLLDSIEHANVYENDNQIDMLTVIRRSNVQNGAVQVWISECSSNE